VEAAREREGTPGENARFTRLDGRPATVGGASVLRLLPRAAKRTIGPWCFFDHFGPGGIGAPMTVGPHPHIGLQTVTWLLDGHGVHSDSLGNVVDLRPGELNLMTAGHGVVHAEIGEEAVSGHGVQLWIAQPERTRHGPPAFVHHSQLPTLRVGDLTATILLGTFGTTDAPAVAATPAVGVDLSGGGRATVPLDPTYEHGIALLSGEAHLDRTPLVPGAIFWSGPGPTTVEIAASADARILLLGGAPFVEEVLMWWNFVARTREEIDAAWRAWNEHDPRFGEVRSTLARIDVDPPTWMPRPESGR
jgi:redox-sensitive bicupin YhaK (pirin superfamily)